ncbi:MAG: hypothetical protein AB8B64_11545 [Granulosicoccus sp.]
MAQLLDRPNSKKQMGSSGPKKRLKSNAKGAKGRNKSRRSSKGMAKSARSLPPDQDSLDDDSPVHRQQQKNLDLMQVEEHALSSEEEELRVFRIFSVAAIFGIPALIWIFFNVIS